jgi:hypothetical protein
MVLPFSVSDDEPAVREPRAPYRVNSARQNNRAPVDAELLRQLGLLQSLFEVMSQQHPLLPVRTSVP